MAYYNTTFGQMPPMPPMIQQVAQAAPQFQQQRIQIDPQQFRQFAITLNDASLNNFAQMARARGISEQDIQKGIQFIKSL